MTLYALERPTSALCVKAVHAITLANLPVSDVDSTPQLVFKGDQLWELPLVNVSADNTPFLATVDADMAGYSKGGQIIAQYDPGFSMHSEPNWDIECYCLWPHTTDYPHWEDVANCRDLMMQVWGKYRDLDSQATLWADAGLHAGSYPSPWRLQPYGFKRRYIAYTNKSTPSVALWFGIRVTEMLGRLPEDS